MGLIAGLFAAFMIDYKSWRDIVFAEIAVVLGAAIGMFIASLSEMWVTGVEFATTIAINFTPSFITNIVMGLIITPILMVAHSAIIRRSGR